MEEGQLVTRCTEADCSEADCSEPDCTEPAAVRLHIPWAENREVCTGHARALVQQDGVVAEPLEDAFDDWQ